MSVNWREMTVTCMLPALIPLEALNVPATVDLREMESTVQVCMSCKCHGIHAVVLAQNSTFKFATYI